MAKKNNPAVSVIIPMYNAKKYIGECLTSLANQTFQDFEVIIADDCSTDNSRSIVNRFVKQSNSGGGI
ncbi:MAG: glycosyltransferase family 2 protein [Selenomonadaceae bacterium]|nr:glycosyltransferase family 2 protein [Selenomonadaceae bacterium]